MVRRIAFAVSRLIAWLLVLAVAGAAALGVLLQVAPLPLTWLSPAIERGLNPSDGSMRVTLGGTQLRLGKERLLELAAVDVRARAPDGETVLHLPAITVGLSFTALLRHRAIAVDRLVIDAPHLFLARRADGSIGLGATALEPALEEVTPQLSLAALTGLMATEPDPREPLSWLQEVRIAGGRVAFDDRVAGETLHARNLDLTLQRGDQALGLRVTFQLEQPGHAADLVLTGAHEVATGRIALSAEFEGLAPPVFASWAPDLPLAGLRLRLNGWAAGTIDHYLALLAPLELAISQGRGVLDLPDLLSARLPIDSLQMRALVTRDLDAAEVDRLHIATLGATLDGRGRAAWPGHQLALSANLEARNVAVEDLASFWPPHAAPEARMWVVEHLTAGAVSEAAARIEVQPGEGPIPESAITGQFKFDDLSVRYFDTMPPLTAVDGSATFNTRRMDFAIARGETGALRVQDGAVTITGIGLEGRDTTRLEVAAKVEGPIPDALALIDHPPLGFARRLGVAPADTAGTARVDLRIGLPLHREVDGSELKVAADAELSQAAIRGLADRIDLSEGRFKLRIDNQGADLVGAGTINGVPLEHIAWREDFGPTGQRRYELRGEIPVTVLAQLGVAAPIPLEGAVGLDATIGEAGQQRTAELSLDLDRLATAVPSLDWQKPAGTPGRLDLSLAMPDQGPLEIERFELMSDGLEAAGRLSVALEPLRLDQLTLTRLRTGATAASGLLERTGKAAYDVTIDAASLDLDPLLQADPLPTEAGPAGLEAVEFRLRLSADRLLFGARELTAVAVDVVRDRDGWRSVEGTARLPAGAPLQLSLRPEELQQSLHFTAGNAADLLRALDQEARVEGGRVDLSAAIFEQRPRLSADGKLEVREFTVLDAPLLARLLSLASLTGIRNLLGGEGIHFDKLELAFSLSEGVLKISKGRMSGSQVGLTVKGEVNLDTARLNLDGTIVPVYAVNRVLGRIPLIGTILSGTEGEGAFAATYRVSGTTDAPDITVNPLSVLAPGLLRELFSGILEGTLEPPDVRQQQN